MVRLDPVRGHEQAGQRPCIVMSSDEIVQDQRFPLIAIVPLTRTPGRGILYPRISSGTGELTSDSYALTDQVRSIDKRRVIRHLGELDEHQMETIEDGLRTFLGL